MNSRATKLLYLTPDERYEVWQVKAAERPELLLIFDDDDEVDHTNEGFLQDGCDIASWRRQSIVVVRSNRIIGTSDDSVRWALRVGQGSPLLRRESQLPLLSSVHWQPWETMKEQLMCPLLTHTKQPVRLSYAPDLHPWFEHENIPALLQGCTDDWRAMESCTFAALVERYGDMYWRFSDTHGETMSLSTYERYCRSLEGQTDAAPLAVYDSQFGTDERAALLEDYTVPACFQNDLFDVLSEDERPPYRWILMGPARSGTGLHIDPAGTHAWVTLIEGCKRWVLFPPSCDVTMHDPQIPSAIWFRDYYPHATAAAAASADARGIVEVVQYPGETVFVPAGWPHAVLNLERSVAITHNYATDTPFFWTALAQEEPHLVEKLGYKGKTDGNMACDHDVQNSVSPTSSILAEIPPGLSP